jgi:hypothetical protein
MRAILVKTLSDSVILNTFNDGNSHRPIATKTGRFMLPDHPAYSESKTSLL